jgi:hypothetical protein
MGSHVHVTSDGNGPKKQREADSKRPLRSRFVVKPRPLQARPGLNFDKIEDLLDEIEGPFHR